MSNVPEGATHYSEAVTDVYFAAYWKEGPAGCWAFVLDDRKDPEWIFYECCELPARAKRIEMPKTWTGEGLPPVCEDCELWLGDGSWVPCTVMFHDFSGAIPVAVVRYAEHTYAAASPKILRPVRTAEQIEAYEREQAVQAMADDIGSLPINTKAIPTLYALYDAGYRKVQS